MYSSVKKVFISTGIAAVSVIIIFLFRYMPSGNLWKGYRIVYVSTDYNNKYIEKVIEKAGCCGVIDLASQNIPLTLAAESPEVSLATAASDENGYLSRRSAYFFDKGGKYQLYYVPDGQTDKAESAVLSLRQAGISAGMDTPADSPWMIPAVCILFAVFLEILATNRIVFACFSVIPVFFSICMPFYSGAAAVCLLLYALFLVQQVWGRRNAFGFVFTNITVLFFTVASLVIAVVTSFRCGLIFITAVIGTTAVMYLLSLTKQKYDQKYSFIPVMICAADTAQFRTKKAKHGMAACAVFIIILTVVLLVSADFSNTSKRLQLPSAQSGSITGRFPSLDDYIVWCWDARTMPYRSLHSSDKESMSRRPKDGDTVEFPRYTENEKGISENNMSIKFNASFRTESLAQIDDLKFPAVEKLLKKQGKLFHAGYTFQSSGGGTMYLVLMIISFFIPLFFFANMYLLAGRWSKNR